ncbi:GH92 family glycosyl hydrolase [Persicobacter psychrovividus]|uniref:Alpha-1 2-mannosidase n=1 Tax=Persicobacter psychrovividus TaxID=387638 RepID=A0ABN6LC53_9BACT|nr:alpha-1 2-mannosidase [Persicobacter psychrovividus]
MLTLLGISCQKPQKETVVEQAKVDYGQMVNPFIGTSNEGNTHPGAMSPWGMTAAAPHNKDFRSRTDNPAIYEYGNPFIYSFASVNLSGIGCPVAGSIPIRVSRGDFNWSVDSFKSSYDQEKTYPGYYGVQLIDHRVEAEMTVTTRTTRFKFTAADDSEPLNIFLDLGSNLSHIKTGEAKKLAGQTIVGYQVDGEFCGVNKQTKIFYALQVEGQPSSLQLVEEAQAVDKEMVEGAKAGALFTFDPKQDKEVEVKIGISFVSAENALANLKAEQKALAFEDIKAAVGEQWNKMLGRIDIEGGAVNDRTVFYTALYHSILLPQVINDVNGDYPDREVNKVGNTEGKYTRYSTYSLWDTYRTVHPLLALVYPEEQRDMTISLVEMYKAWGWIPKWELFGYDTYCMVGDPALPVIADTYMKGITDFDVETALEGMVKSATTRENNPIRPGIKYYLDLGYLPMDDRGGDRKDFSFTNGIVWGPVSTTLEYNFSDFGIAQVAKALGKEELYQQFYKQSHSFVNLYDRETTFFRPKNKDGSWLTPYNPLDRFWDVRWKKSGGPGYVEGNAWQYAFFVPHAMDTLQQIMGEEVFASKLHQMFSEKHFDMTNEPDITFPFLFNYINGQERSTQQYVREVAEKNFFNAHNGIPGNDDAGTLSAWLVFADLGIFPDAPGIPTYQLSTPKFKKATIKLPDYVYGGKTLVIEKSAEVGRYFNRVEFADGTPVDGYSVDHQALLKGGGLKYEKRSSL